MKHRVFDVANHRLDIGAHVGGKEADGEDAPRGKPLGPALIVFRRTSHIVRIAVHLDAQSSGATVEIQEIRVEQVLAAELEAARTRARRRQSNASGGLMCRRSSRARSTFPITVRPAEGPLHHATHGPPPRQMPGRMLRPTPTTATPIA